MLSRRNNYGMSFVKDFQIVPSNPSKSCVALLYLTVPAVGTFTSLPIFILPVTSSLCVGEKLLIPDHCKSHNHHFLVELA